MRIAVIDGQGGGVGRTIVERLHETFGNKIDIVVLGTNALATSLMLKAGGNEGASGENAIAFNAPRADIIIGSVAILAANSMLGELTPGMARAIAESPAKKVLIPLNRCNIQVAGVSGEPLPHYIDYAMQIVKESIGGKDHV